MIVGNWKMYKTIEEAKAFVQRVAPLITESQGRIMLAVPFTAIQQVAKLVADEKLSIAIGAQNMHNAEEGAFTGEIAGRMLKEAGARFVIIGHSERRHLFHEDESCIHKKVQRAFQDGLQPILCIGETSDERKAGKRDEVLTRQLVTALKDISEESMASLILAYEPVWAIGTGDVATPEDAQEVHAFCRALLKKLYSAKIANALNILYGGSVKPDNAAALLAEPDIDGLLVGGASLLPESFSQIVNTGVS